MGLTEEEWLWLSEEAKAKKCTDSGIWQTCSPMPPEHRVRITKPFYLGIGEVTQAEYKRMMGSNPSSYTGDPTSPWNQVNWDEASAFCRKLGELAQGEEAGAVLSVADEAEWEYTCRAGTTTTWCLGTMTKRWASTRGTRELWRDDASRASEDAKRVGPVRHAWQRVEWCQDWQSEGHYKQSPDVDPTGPPEGWTGVPGRGQEGEAGMQVGDRLLQPAVVSVRRPGLPGGVVGGIREAKNQGP